MNLPRRDLIAYALPALPLAAMYLPAYVFVANHYAATFGLSLSALGLCLIAIRVFDAASDPLIGYLSDRTPARLGRRRVWLLAAVPVSALGALALFAPPAEPGLGWFTGAFALLTLGWSMALTPYFAWGAEITGDYEERSRVALWRESLGLIGTVAAAVLYGAGGAEGMARIAWLIAGGLPVAVVFMLWRLPEPLDRSRGASRIADVLAILRREPIFGRLVLAQFFNGFANGIAATLFVLFVSWRLDRPDLAGPLLIAYFLAAVLGGPFWMWAGKRMAKHRLWCLAMIYAGCVFGFTATLGPGDWMFFLVICLLSGAALGADLAIPASIQADLVDLATAQSGSQQTGAFFALWSLINKLAVALSSGLALVLLGWAGFAPGGESTEGGKLALTLLYAGGPIFFKGIAIALMWHFSVGADDQRHWRARIEEGVRPPKAGAGAAPER